MRLEQKNYKLRGGNITLYTIATDRHGYWQCRMKLGKNRKLVRRSTKTTDLNDAKRVAEELYDDLRYKLQNNQQLNDGTFKQLCNDFMKKVKRDGAEGRLSIGRVNLIQGTIDRYLNPYFGKKLVSDITAADFNVYDDWRLDYWTTGYGAATRKANSKSVPSAKTLAIEQSVLRQILRFGVEQNYLKQMPYMRPKQSKTNRRGAFDVGEYRLMITDLRKRIATENHTRIKRDRILLEIYIRFMIGTGLRVGEARKLNWADIEFITTGKGVETLRLWVDGKTGKRAVIGTMGAKRAVKALLQFYEYENLGFAKQLNTPLFMKEDGGRLHTFEIGFGSLLKRSALEYDRQGNKRTLYSLRHSYATYRLLYGGTDVYLLAKNMGTSVGMIEQHYGHVNTTLAAEKLV